MSYDLGGGKTGIYFLVGNLYDYDTDADTGNDYILNGGLPEWGKIGITLILVVIGFRLKMLFMMKTYKPKYL